MNSVDVAVAVPHQLTRRVRQGELLQNAINQ